MNRIRLLVVFFGFITLVVTNNSFAAVYKCKTSEGVRYSATPCAGINERDKNEKPVIKQPQDSISNSINGHAETIEQALENWHCDSLMGAAESIPSRVSMSALLNNFASLSKADVEKLGTISHKRGLATTKIAIPTRVYNNRCYIKLSTNLRSSSVNEKFISATINIHPTTKNKEGEITANAILGLLRKNGYRLKKRKDSSKEYYTDSWKTGGVSCSAGLSLRYNSFDYVSISAFNAKCRK